MRGRDAHGAAAPSAVQTPVLDPPPVAPAEPDLDEFDLDLRLGELTVWGTAPSTWNPLDAQTDPAGCVPTGGKGAEGGTCDTDDPTCPGTCAGRDTCPATQCGATCAHTCGDTCPHTCADTCAHTCDCTDFCGTEFNTHCNTCRCNHPG